MVRKQFESPLIKKFTECMLEAIRKRKEREERAANARLERLLVALGSVAIGYGTAKAFSNDPGGDIIRKNGEYHRINRR